LTINSTANVLGLVENTATLTGYVYCGDQQESESYSCGDPYVDSVGTNNTSSAFINVVAVPVVPAPVTPTPTPATPSPAPAKAPDTGFGVLNASPVSAVLGFGLVAAGFFGFAFVTRRFVKQ